MREACASSGDDGGWADVGLGAPSTKFACCSWWPDVGAIGLADGARSDQRWIEGTSVGDALETMAAKASKCTRDTDDEDDELTATTPAEAAARALELIRQSSEPAGRGCYVDVVWITAGVGSDRSEATSTGGANESVGGGGGGGGERWWPGEAVAAWGVLRAAKAAGARCAVVALAPVTRNSAGDSRTMPATIRAVAARTGAEASLFRGGKSSGGGGGAGVGLDPGLRWRGSMLVPSSNSTTPTTLTGFSLSAPGSRSRSIPVRADADSQPASERRRVDGDMVLLEVVRLEVIPPTHLSSRPALRFFAASDEPKAEAEAEAEAATGAGAAAGGVMRAWTSVVESVPPARAPAFIVRISLGDGSVGTTTKTNKTTTKTTGGKPPPAPHGSGPVLMIYADGSGGFLASALASFPALLRRALVRVSAQREADDSFSLGATPERNRGTGEGVSKAATSAGAGASEMTTESGGGKRLRSSRSGRSSRKTTTTGDGAGGRGRRGEDEDDSAATRADLGEEALKAVAMMDVNASLNTALDLATVHATNATKETSFFGEGKRRRRSVRLSQGASRSAGTHSSVGVAHQPGVRRAYGAEGGVAPPPVHRMLDVLVQRQEAASDDAAAQLCPDDDSYDDVPFLTGVLLKTAADVAAGDDVLRWALRAAGELAASEENGEGCDGEGREIAVADSGGFQEAPSKSGASSHQHVDLALGGAGADDDDDNAGGGRPTPSERARQKDRRERTRTALAPGKKGNLASISGKRGAAILAAAGGGGGGGGGGRGQATRGRRQHQPQTQQPQQPEREPSESAAGAGRVAAGTAAAAVAKKCPACDIDLAPIPGMKHCYGCGGPL